MNDLKAPKVLLKFLKWFCNPSYHIDIEGDLLEIYERRALSRGKRKADWLLLKDILLLFRPGIIRSIRIVSPTSELVLLLNSIRQSFRMIRKSKLTFGLNIAGFSSGLICILFIYLWVSDELKVDKFHVNDDTLTQVLLVRQSNGVVTTDTDIPAPLAKDLLAGVSGIDHAVATAIPYQSNTLSVGEATFSGKAIYVDKGFFEMFSFPLITGEQENAIPDLQHIVISKQMALHLYGKVSNAVGKSISFDKKEQFIISGVFDEIPKQSTLQFDFALSLPLYEKHTGLELSWGESVANVFLQLSPNRSIEALNEDIMRYLVDDGVNVQETKVFTRPFSAGYLHGNYKEGIQDGGRITYIRLFILIGLVVLIIACINFISIATATATERWKEVGMKKVLGAKRRTIVLQQLLEVFILTSIAGVFAISLVYLLLPYFNELSGKQISFQLNGEMIGSLFFIMIITALIAGFYPAIHLAGFQPKMLLKGNAATPHKKQWIRKGLVVTQFSAAIILVIFTVVFYQQFSMIQNRSLGYNKDNILYFEMSGQIAKHRETFLTSLKKIKGVKEASSVFTMQNGLLGEEMVTNDISWPGKHPDDIVLMDYRIVDYDLIELMDMEIKAGRSFSREFSSELFEIVINETAAKTLGYENPVGKKVKIWGQDKIIIGVVSDFSKSIHEGETKPLFLIRLINRGFGALNNVIVKLEQGNTLKTVQSIASFHQEFNPDFPFNYNFLDHDFQQKFQYEKNLSVMSKYFSGLVILISCLGLFGLTTFMVNKRKKEIGIRKVLGSGQIKIMFLLYKNLAKLLVIALMIALPVSYSLTHAWLDRFAIRVDLTSWIFIGTSFFFTSLMLIVASLQIVKVLSVNPCEILKTE